MSRRFWNIPNYYSIYKFYKMSILIGNKEIGK